MKNGIQTNAWRELSQENHRRKTKENEGAQARTKGELAERAEDHRGNDADEYPCGDPAEEKDRKIEEHPEIFDKSCRYQELAEIVEDTGRHAHADDRKEVSFLKKNHADKTHSSPGQRIEHAESAGEKKSGYNYPDDADGYSFFGAELVERDNSDDIRYAELDTRDARIIWYNGFDI
jgi:hypothetical protein